MELGTIITEFLKSSKFEIKCLTPDASNRRYYRIIPEDGRGIILMKLADEPFKSEEISNEEKTEELPFINVQKYLQKVGAPVPEIYYYDEKNGVLFLEDLGDITLEKLIMGGGDILKWYKKTIELLLQIEIYAKNNPDDECIAFKRNFNEKLLLWEFEHFYEYGLKEKGKKLSLNEEKILRKMFHNVVSILKNSPYIFSLRDYQSRNFLLQGENLRIIDFQDALLAPFPYDLVCLLRDSYIELKEDELFTLLKIYFEYGKKSSLFDSSYDEFLQKFFLLTIQRKLKDTGRFVFIDRVKKNPSFLQFIPLSMKYVFHAMEFLGRFNDAYEILKKFF